MENLVWIIPAVACPLMMLGMMWMMGKGMGTMRKDKERERTVSELRAESQRLEDQIERRESEEADGGASSSSTPRHA